MAKSQKYFSSSESGGGTMKLENAIARCNKSLQIFVLVGGSIVDKEALLKEALDRGVHLRFLFPSTTSEWFTSYIASAGLSVDDYSERVRHNAKKAEILGPQVEVRRHAYPVHCWFVVIDNRIVLTKPIAFFSPAPKLLIDDASTVAKFGQNFDRAWVGNSNSEPRSRCFLSYSRADEAIAKRMRDLLLRSGIECWRDLDDIPKGANWDLEIQCAIDKSSHILLLATKNSVQSENVADELGYAKDKKKTIIPLILEELALPLRVHRAQGIEFVKNFDVGMELLLGVLR